MFDDTVAYLIRTGRIMRRNGLYMIVLPRDGTEIQGKRINVRVCVHVCVFVVCLVKCLITHIGRHLEVMFAL